MGFGSNRASTTRFADGSSAHLLRSDYVRNLVHTGR
jgi:hypothetical protein